MNEIDVPESHPRYEQLVMRHRIESGVEKGLTHYQGLIAEGRGEAFDYLIGEQTLPSADGAARVAAAHFLLADQAVISVNGNVAALVPDEVIELAAVTGADVEVNLFNHTQSRVRAIVDHLRDHGLTEVKGLSAEARIPGLDHDRGRVAREGLYAADVVLVPLEDGDRTAALEAMNKTVVAVDLNPLSRSAQVATVPIVDNVIRALPNVTNHARELAGYPHDELESIVEGFDATAALRAAERAIRDGGDSDVTIDGPDPD